MTEDFYSRKRKSKKERDQHYRGEKISEIFLLENIFVAVILRLVVL